METAQPISHVYLSGADGIRLHAATAGESGPLLLCLHGFPEFWRAWERQLAEFSSDFRVVAPDLRGYNLSDKPEGTDQYTLRKLVEDARAVIDQLSPDRPAFVIGHDWGGLIAWTLARDHRERLDRLVIINAPHPVLFQRELRQNPAQDLASMYAGFFQLRGLAEGALEAFDHAALRKMIFGITRKPQQFDPELRAAYQEAWSRPGALKASLEYYRNIRDFMDEAKDSPRWRIDVPTLVLWGDQDPSLLRSNLVGLDEFVSKLTIQRHPVATHWIVHEEPNWVNEYISSFLRRRDAEEGI